MLSQLDKEDSPELSRIPRLVLDSEPEGTNLIVSQYGGILTEYLRAMVGEGDEFPAIMAEVLVSILSNIRSPSARKPGAFTQYVFECAVGTLKREFSWVYDSPTPERQVFPSANDLRRFPMPPLGELRDAMWALAPSDRELLFLRFRMGFNYDQVSDILREARVSLEERFIEARLRFRAALLNVKSTPLASANDV